MAPFKLFNMTLKFSPIEIDRNELQLYYIIIRERIFIQIIVTVILEQKS
jgi:hypothetical protein